MMRNPSLYAISAIATGLIGLAGSAAAQTVLPSEFRPMVHEASGYDGYGFGLSGEGCGFGQGGGTGYQGCFVYEKGYDHYGTRNWRAPSEPYRAYPSPPPKGNRGGYDRGGPKGYRR